MQGQAIDVCRNEKKNIDFVCAVCGRNLPRRQLVAGATVRPAVADTIRLDPPEWSAERSICRENLAQYRGRYVRRLLEPECGELTTREQEVVESLAYRIASFGGSWAFPICFGVFMLLRITANSLALLWRPVDPHHLHPVSCRPSLKIGI